MGEAVCGVVWASTKGAWRVEAPRTGSPGASSHKSGLCIGNWFQFVPRTGCLPSPPCLHRRPASLLRLNDIRSPPHRDQDRLSRTPRPPPGLPVLRPAMPEGGTANGSQRSRSKSPKRPVASAESKVGAPTTEKDWSKVLCVARATCITSWFCGMPRPTSPPVACGGARSSLADWAQLLELPSRSQTLAKRSSYAP